MSEEEADRPKVGVAQTSIVMAAVDALVAHNMESSVAPVMFIKPWGRQELYAAPMCNALESPSILEVLEDVNIEQYVMLAVGKQISIKGMEGDSEATQKAIKEIIDIKSRIVKDYMKSTDPKDFDPDEVIRRLRDDKCEDKYDLEVVDGAIIVEMFGDREFSAEARVETRGGYRYLGQPTYSNYEEEEFFLAGRTEEGNLEKKARALPYGEESNGVCSDEAITELKEALAAIGFVMTQRENPPFFKWGSEINENKISDQAVSSIN